MGVLAAFFEGGLQPLKGKGFFERLNPATQFKSFSSGVEAAVEEFAEEQDRAERVGELRVQARAANAEEARINALGSLPSDVQKSFVERQLFEAEAAKVRESARFEEQKNVFGFDDLVKVGGFGLLAVGAVVAVVALSRLRG